MFTRDNSNLSESTINFNKMVASKVNLITTETGEMAFINDNLDLTRFYYKGRPVIDPVSENLIIMGGIIFNPLENKSLMKSIFDYFIENNTEDYVYDREKQRVFRSAFTFDKPYVLVYGRCKSPYKNDRRSCIELVMSNGQSFTTSPYFNDSLKYLECIDFMMGAYAGEGFYNAFDTSIEEMNPEGANAFDMSIEEMNPEGAN